MTALNDLELYNLLVSTVNVISQTPYAQCFVLKGGLALMSKMFEFNRSDLFRRTSDIDIHCSSKDLWIKFYNDCENILNASIFAKSSSVHYKLIKRRSDLKGLDTSDSLTFEVSFKDGRFTTISMDMNIKSDNIVEISFDSVLNMNTYSEYTMLADKIAVVSSDKIYRRIKIYMIFVF